MYEINSSAFTHRENRAKVGRTDTLADTFLVIYSYSFIFLFFYFCSYLFFCTFAELKRIATTNQTRI